MVYDLFILLFNTCRHNAKLFFKDAPPDVPMTVVSAKGEGGQSICLKCLYVKRGSFKQLKTPDWLRLKKRNPPLQTKFLC